MTCTDRRTLIGAALAAPLVAVVAPAPALAGTPRSDLVYIGMQGDTIHAARFDPRTGDLTAIGPVAQGLRPTWAVRHPVLPILYFTDEAGNDGAGQGGVLAYRVDPATGALTAIGNVRAGGGGTTHLAFDRRSSTLLTANYGGASSATIPVGTDGVPGAATAVLHMTGSGPHRRQAAPHPHCAWIDPAGRFALVADLGTDKVWVLPFDGAGRKYGVEDPAAHASFISPPGSGPRHIAAHPDGRALYLICELTAGIQTLGWDARNGVLTHRQTVSLNSPGFTGAGSGAEIAVSRDGRFVYASNRGENSLVVFAVDRRTRALTQVQSLPSGGDKPWHFTVHPNGRWLLVANRDANAIRVFAIDSRSGRLTDTGRSLGSPTPVHVHIF
jgi:6-phosphogluconolactonase